MANFDEALTFVLANEGGFSDNPNDRGGRTNHGISSALLSRLKGYPRDPKDLSFAQVRDIYYKEFWLKAPFTSLWNQRIANYIFDCCVLHGIGTGIEITQRAVWSVLGYQFLKDDGVMGTKTLAAIQQAGYLLMYAIVVERAAYCRLLCIKDNEQREFLNGWLKRCYRI